MSNSFLNACFKVALHGLEGMQSHSPDDARDLASVTVFLCYCSAVEPPTGGSIFLRMSVVNSSQKNVFAWRKEKDW